MTCKPMDAETLKYLHDKYGHLFPSADNVIKTEHMEMQSQIDPTKVIDVYTATIPYPAPPEETNDHLDCFNTIDGN